MKLKTKKIRMKPCKHCDVKFQPERQMQETCSVKCAIELTNVKREKKNAKDAANVRKKERDATKANNKRKREFTDNDKSHQTKLTQDVFNKWIRTIRDADEPCISCDTESIAGGIGGAWDCGHFLSRGACPELKFEPLNAYKQCKKCNGGSGRYAHKANTVAQEYERRLIIKIGQDKVDWLRGPHEAKKYTCEQLREIRAYYSRLIRENIKTDDDRPYK